MARSAGHYGSSSNSQQAVLGFTSHGEGRLAVYGDSNCLDSSHQRSSCFGLLTKAIQYVAEVSLSAVGPAVVIDGKKALVGWRETKRVCVEWSVDWERAEGQ